MNYLGTITEIREHPIAPLKVEVDVGEGLLEGWLMVSFAAWTVMRKKDLKPGMQVLVWRSPIEDDDYKYRVVDVFPTVGLTLPDNSKALARQGDSIGIRGSSKLNPAAVAATMAGTPQFPLGHDLVGRIIEDE